MHGLNIIRLTFIDTVLFSQEVGSLTFVSDKEIVVLLVTIT